MADTHHSDAVRVTAEERTHPALQKIARALISLVRWQQEGNAVGSEGSPPGPTAEGPATASEKNCHE
jgi:hypothetical protein